MNMHTPLEGLLRPPLEWVTAASMIVAATILLVYPKLFLLDSTETYFLVCGFVILSTIRFKQGIKVWRYQRNLKCMPTYTMGSKELPVKKNKLFLGKGFLWTAQHTQRLRDLDLDFNLHYKYPSRLKNWAQQYSTKNENNFLARLLKKDHWLNPFRP